MESRHLEARATVNDVRIERIGGHIGVLVCRNRMPVVRGDRAVVAAAQDAGRTALLLSSVNPIRMLIIGDYVIKLSSWLVVPGTPGASAVDRDRGALVDAKQDDVGIFRIDPDGVVVVAARRAFPRDKGFSGVSGLVSGRVRHVNSVLVLGRNANPCEVRPASPDPVFSVNARPALPGVVRAVDAALCRRIDHGEHALRIAGSYSDPDAA